jgi:hypothetical protein
MLPVLMHRSICLAAGCEIGCLAIGRVIGVRLNLSLAPSILVSCVINHNVAARFHIGLLAI